MTSPTVTDARLIKFLEAVRQRVDARVGAAAAVGQLLAQLVGGERPRQERRRHPLPVGVDAADVGGLVLDGFVELLVELGQILHEVGGGRTHRIGLAAIEERQVLR